jgi:hypothetical protein
MDYLCVIPNCKVPRELFEAYCSEVCQSKDNNLLHASRQGLYFANGQYGPPWTAGLSFDTESSIEILDCLPTQANVHKRKISIPVVDLVRETEVIDEDSRESIDWMTNESNKIQKINKVDTVSKIRTDAHFVSIKERKPVNYQRARQLQLTQKTQGQLELKSPQSNWFLNGSNKANMKLKQSKLNFK